MPFGDKYSALESESAMLLTLNINDLFIKMNKNVYMIDLFMSKNSLRQQRCPNSSYVSPFGMLHHPWLLLSLVPMQNCLLDHFPKYCPI